MSPHNHKIYNLNHDSFIFGSQEIPIEIGVEKKWWVEQKETKI